MERRDLLSMRAYVKPQSENFVFLKRLLKNPKSLGAVAPSSRRLGDFIARSLSNFPKDSLIVELGAGTGSLTRSLLEAGYSKLTLIEMDGYFAKFLRFHFPSLSVIEGDASSLQTLLPSDLLGKVDVVLSGIPMMNLNQSQQKSIIQSSFEILRPGGSFVQFTYGPLSPISCKTFSLSSKRLGSVLLNVPPATVWEYQRDHRPWVLGSL